MRIKFKNNDGTEVGIDHRNIMTTRTGIMFEVISTIPGKTWNLSKEQFEELCNSLDMISKMELDRIKRK